MFNRILVRVRKYIHTKLINSEIKRLIRENATMEEEFNGYAADMNAAIDILRGDKDALQERCKKLEQEVVYFKNELLNTKASADKYIDDLRANFAKRENELMGMVARAEANCKIAETRYSALEEAVRDYVIKLETECGDCEFKRNSEDDLK